MHVIAACVGLNQESQFPEVVVSMFRRAAVSVLVSASLLVIGCSNKKVQNPMANIDSKQPDKVLYDRAMDAMKHNKYDVARLSLQTLINTYPDSEYIARAKLAIGDSWYAEGGSAAMAQAESEYKDFQTFFPNMPEAAEAQLKIANIHYKEMEKADRDFTHAKRAEEEYRQLILQYPDSKLVPEAKQRLLQVQEVLAQREYMVGHFYYVREAWPAAIARLKSVSDTYPLYSGADEVLYELGSAYEREIDLMRRSKMPESVKGPIIKKYTDNAAAAYDRILTRYPMEERAADAKKRLQALNRPIPTATPEAIAQNKAEIASRSAPGMTSKLMENFKHGPDMSEATKAGEPTLVDPKQTSAPEMVRSFTSDVQEIMKGGTGKAKVETLNTAGGTPPPENAPIPRSDAASGSTDNPAPASASPAPGAAVSSAGGASNYAASDMKNDLAPATPPPAAAPPAPSAAPQQAPAQVNDAAGAGNEQPAPADGSAPASAQAAGGSSSPSASSGAQQTAPAADPNTESTSKKKKKHIWPF